MFWSHLIIFLLMVNFLDRRFNIHRMFLKENCPSLRIVLSLKLRSWLIYLTFLLNLVSSILFHLTFSFLKIRHSWSVINMIWKTILDFSFYLCCVKVINWIFVRDQPSRVDVILYASIHMMDNSQQVRAGYSWKVKDPTVAFPAVLTYEVLTNKSALVLLLDLF